MLQKNNHGGVAQLGEHLPCKQGVIGSNPFISTTCEPLAQSVEHMTFNHGVRGSIPRWLTKQESLTFHNEGKAFLF